MKFWFPIVESLREKLNFKFISFNLCCFIYCMHVCLHFYYITLYALLFQIERETVREKSTKRRKNKKQKKENCHYDTIFFFNFKKGV